MRISLFRPVMDARKAPYRKRHQAKARNEMGVGGVVSRRDGRTKGLVVADP